MNNTDNQPQPKTIDDIFYNLSTTVFGCGFERVYSSKILTAEIEAKQAILDLLLSQPELQVMNKEDSFQGQNVLEHNVVIVNIRTAIKRVMGMEASDE